MDHGRYVIRIQNPVYSQEVFIWDREEKRVVVSFSYRELTIRDQMKAKDRCIRYLNDVIRAEEGAQ